MTSDGMIWMGLAFQGLARFDPAGHELKRFPHDPNDQGSISHDFAYVVLEDSQGYLWVGTQDGPSVPVYSIQKVGSGSEPSLD